MVKSYTLQITLEVLEKIKDIYGDKYLKTISSEKEKKLINGPNKITFVDKVLDKWGLQRKKLAENFIHNLVNNLENIEGNYLGKSVCIGTLFLILKDHEKFDNLYNLFSDQNSKIVFEKIIKYRLAYTFLGEYAYEFFPLNISKTQYEKLISNLNFQDNILKIENFSFYDCPKGYFLAFPMTWILNHYEISGKCEISEDDYVFDTGAFIGDTSFWFLYKGAKKVYAFEPDPINFSYLVKNIEFNKVEDKIFPVNKILSNKEGKIPFIITGSGCSMKGKNSIKKESMKEIESITLDYFVEKEKINKLDFIKMDVEGSELEVIKGGLETIKKFKPKMAISVYHKPEDLITIPTFILNILPEAKLFLSHKFYDWQETVLFVNPR